MKLTREEIHALGGFSNLSEDKCDDLLQKKLFAQPDEWKKFLKIAFLVLGVGFIISGIIFFFAYNWDDLHKYIKLTLIQLLIPIGIGVNLFFKGHQVIRQLGAITATMMVGVSFAVYGQIYQTGANDFDFFLNWCAVVFVWVVLANSAAHWLLYIVLLNITIFTYYYQYAYTWTFEDLYGILFLINALLLIIFTVLGKKTSLINTPRWFLIPLAIIAVYYSTVGISVGIFNASNPFFSVFLMAVATVYAIGIYQGYKSRQIYYLGTIYLSSMIIVSAAIMNLTNSLNEIIMFLLSLFFTAGTTVIVVHFISLKKRWKK